MKNSAKKSLTERERSFCRHYVNVGNPREAAALAGYGREPERKGIGLLSKEAVKEEIDRLYGEKRKNLAYKACMGYERLAFGSVADAIRLLYVDELDEVGLEAMDLFGISEIKRPKDGAIEIKFFDRLRALEKLEQSDVGRTGALSPFYYAVERGMKAIAPSLKGDGEE